MSTSQSGPRVTRVVAWGSCVLFVALWAVAIGLVASGSGTSDQAIVGIAGGFALVGALVAVREPRNPVGWLMVAFATTFALQGVVDAYVYVPGRPLGTAAAWVSSWIWYVWLYLAALVLPLLFPAGRLLSGWWRWPLLSGIAALVLTVVGAAFARGKLNINSPHPVENPLGVDGPAATVVEAAGAVGQVLAAVGYVLSVVCLVLRLRRSEGRERLQVTWFVYVGAMVLAGLTTAIFAALVDARPGPAPAWADVVGAIGWFSAAFLMVLGLPAAIGVAMLKHRLYGIEVVVKRTLVYGGLTVILASAYLSLVLLLRIVLDPLTGESDLAVAASTLAVAALFRPVRARIQAGVDRRFFRSRYDAARTADAFAARLRQQVDLDAITHDLRAVVRGTVHPTHVSVWLRSGS